MMHVRSRTMMALIAGLGSAACDSNAESGAAADATRDTLPSGQVVVSYASLPDSAMLIQPDLRIGQIEGEDAYIFGNVRGVEADADGQIYIFDYQVPDVRVFGPDGQFLRTLTSGGEGPGEISEANGIQMVGDSILWIQDYGRWTMLGLGLDGRELARVPMAVLSYGYIWSGWVDDRGRIWKGTSHSDAQRAFPPEEGLSETSSRSYLKFFDPESQTADSIFLGERQSRSFISQTGNGGYRYRSIPFSTNVGGGVSPEGLPWVTGGTTEFSLSRLDLSGDTTLTIRAEVDPLPVTASHREEYVESVSEQLPGSRSANEQIAALMPDFKPAIAGMVFDDRGRVWVRRTLAEGDETHRYDVFDREGVFQGAVRIDLGAFPNVPIRIRGDHLYAVVTDEMDVPFVVRVPLPSELRR